MQKKSNLIPYLFLILSTVSIANLNASATTDTISIPATAEHINQAVSNETIEELKKLILKMFVELEFTVETLSIYVKSNDITVSDKQTVLDNLIKFRQIIGIISQETMMHYSMESVTRALKAISILQKHVKTAVDNGFNEFPLFDAENLQLRSVVELTPEEIKNEACDLSAELTQIKKEAENAGISLWNKFYRNVPDKFIIEPISKYGIHTKLGLGTVVASAAIFFWYRFSQDSNNCLITQTQTIKNVDYNAGNTLGNTPNDSNPGWYNWYLKANGTMRHYLGRPSFDSIKREDIPGDFLALSTGKLARVEDLINLYNAGAVALGSYYFWPQVTDFYNNHIAPTINYGAKKVYDAHCYCKGGIYYKQNKNKSDKPFSINPRFRFKDIIGYEDAKEIGNELIRFIEDPEKFQRQTIAPPKGILLYGPPGTGKSFWAEALCGEVQDALKKNNRNEREFGFYIIKSTHIQQMGLDTVLSLMKKWAPCIVFIDEIDLLSLQRDRNPERLAEFLSGISGFLSEADPKKQVIIVGATNKLENVDTAITRAGRLSKRIYLDYPTLENRYEFLRATLADRTNPQLFDLAKIARQTAGCTIEDLRNIINTALFRTRVRCTPLAQHDLEAALNSELRNISQHQELNLSEQEQHILAVHMAGHAFAQMNIPTQRILSAVTIKPVNTKMKEESVWSQYYKEQEPGQIYGKLFTYCPQDSLGSSNTQTLLNECKILLAGRVAEKVILGSISSNNNRTCSGSCKPNAFNIAKQILLNGLDEAQLSKTMKEELLTKTHQLLQELEAELTKIIEEQKSFVIFIAELLLQHKTVSHEEIITTLEQTVEQIKKDDPELMKKLEKEALEEELNLKEAIPSAA